MRHQAYTDDAICSAMGLGPFKQVDAQPQIRLMLRPSFHPEVFIALEPTKLRAVGLLSMLWRQEFPCRIPDFSETVDSSEHMFHEIAALFRVAFDEYNRTDQRKYITLDGMPVSALLIEGGITHEIHSHPRNEISRFVGALIRHAHALTQSVHLRNRIAECSRYNGEEIPIEPEPPPRNMTNIVVLGDPDARAEFFDLLKNKSNQTSQRTDTKGN
jgi:hypothetical protein